MSSPADNHILSRIGDAINSAATKFATWFAQAMGNNFSPTILMGVLAFATGLLSGAAATLLKWLIGRTTSILTHGMHLWHSNWVLLLLPLIGILIAYFFQRKIAYRDIYHGVDRLNKQLAAGNGDLPIGLTFQAIIASTFTLGFGGSAGSEGPIAYTGAAIGSNVGKSCRLSSKQLQLMAACGAAAGIAGIFKAPIGGAFFALECLAITFSGVEITMLLIASMTAGLTAYWMSGLTADIDYIARLGFDVHWLPWIIALGLFAGLYSIYYQTVMEKMAKRYALFKNHWVRNLIAGGCIGLSIFLFPALYGEGYGFMSQLLNGNTEGIISSGPWADAHLTTGLVIAMLGIMMVIKCWATVSTTSGGGVAGDFAPALFAGCITGYFFATVANVLFNAQLPAGYFAFFGMAAVMAATQRAPLMAIFLTVEMGAAYRLLLPVSIVAVISFLTFRAIPQYAKKVRTMRATSK